MSYVIEKNVPLVSACRGGKTSKTGLIEKMEIGDSFVVVSQKEAELFRRLARAIGAKMSGRKVEGGYRLWRVA